MSRDLDPITLLSLFSSRHTHALQYNMFMVVYLHQSIKITKASAEGLTLQRRRMIFCNSLSLSINSEVEASEFKENAPEPMLVICDSILRIILNKLFRIYRDVFWSCY